MLILEDIFNAKSKGSAHVLLGKGSGNIWTCTYREKGNFIVINEFKYGQTWKICPPPLSLSLYSTFKDFHALFRQTFCYAYSFPLQFFLFLKILQLVLNLANFIMIGLLLPLFLGAPSLCDLSISSFLISSPIYSLILSITSSSVFLFFLFRETMN